MDVGRYLVQAHLREGRPVSELARLHGFTAAGCTSSWRDTERSHWHLARERGAAPSASSIMRLLRRRGLVVPAPRKRPRASFIRFAAALPNQLWQTDATHWTLADGSAVEILNVIDDHSRLVLAACCFRTVKAADVVATFHPAADRHGYPAALLSDNGAVFSGASRNGKVLLESELERLGIRPSHARPPAATLAALQTQLDRFRVQYNVHRPHRAIGRQTPAAVFAAKVKAGPGSAAPAVHYRVRYDQVDRDGTVTLRYDSRLHHIGLGRQHRGRPIVLFVADRDIRIVTEEGELLRQLVLDPTRDYQRQSA